MIRHLKVSILCIVALLALHSSNLYAQNTSGFNEEAMAKVEARWTKLQPRTNVVLLSGEEIFGQLVSVGPESLTIYTGTDFLLENSDRSLLVTIPFKDIGVIKNDNRGPKYTGLIAGGLILGGSGFLGGMILAGGWSYIPGLVLGGIGAGGGAWAGHKIQKGAKRTEFVLRDFNDVLKLRKSSIFGEELKYFSTPPELLENSASVRRVFPDKHLRISFGASIGPNMVKNTLTDMIESTSLPSPSEYRHGPIAFDFFDVSWRFNDRLIVGGQMHLNSDSYTYMFYEDYWQPTTDLGISYNYNIQYFEARFYGEYALSPVTRYFSKKYELLVGGGVIYSQPFVDISYSYVPDIITGNTQYIENPFDKSTFGLQARSSIHYYLFPGFSLFAGLEANLIGSTKIPELVLPSNNPPTMYTLPAHKLNFSTVRAKVGASIYF